MADLTAEAIKQLVTLGGQLAAPMDIGDGIRRYMKSNGELGVIVPSSHLQYAENPPRVTQIVTVTDADSFLDYWQLFSNIDSRVFGSRDGLQFVGIIDYHGAAIGGSELQPEWGTHKLILKLRYTEEWLAWTGKNGQKSKMTQAEFAEFVEDNSPDISDPPAATMVELATTLQATSEAQFDQATNLQTGKVQLSYREEIKGTYGAKKADVPREFKIRISVFEGQPPITVTARIRYRINSGHLTVWYDLLHVERHVREAFALVSNEIELKGISVFQGEAR